MFKNWVCMLLILLPNLSFAADDEFSDECLRSMQNLYKFYYYEIQPNPRNKECNPEERLSSTETLKMQNVIGELKKHCPEATIARINENIKSEAIG